MTVLSIVEMLLWAFNVIEYVVVVKMIVWSTVILPWPTQAHPSTSNAQGKLTVQWNKLLILFLSTVYSTAFSYSLSFYSNLHSLHSLTEQTEQKLQAAHTSAPQLRKKAHIAFGLMVRTMEGTNSH